MGVQAVEKAENEDRAPGTTTMAPEVLIAISQLTALGVEGVHGLAPVPGGVNRLFKRVADEGVEISVEDNRVSIELHLIMDNGVNIREVGRTVQHEVARAVEEMVGMKVDRVDVHVRDIAFGDDPLDSG